MSSPDPSNSAPGTPQDVSVSNNHNFNTPNERIPGVKSPGAFGYADSPEPDELVETVAVKRVIENLKIVFDENETETKKIPARKQIVNLVQKNQDVQLHIRYDMEFRRDLFRDTILRNEFSKSVYENVFDVPRGYRVKRMVKCFTHLQMEQLLNTDLMFNILKAAMEGSVVIYLATSEPGEYLYQMEIEKIENPKSKFVYYTLFRSVSTIPGDYSEKRLIDFSCPDIEKWTDHKDQVSALSFFMYMLEQKNVKFYARISEELKDSDEWIYLNNELRYVKIPVLQDSYLRSNKVFEYDTENIMWATDDGWNKKPLLSFTAYEEMTPEENPFPPSYPSPPKYKPLKLKKISPPRDEAEDNSVLTEEERQENKRGLSPTHSSVNKKPKMGNLSEPPESSSSQHFVVQTSHVKR